MSQPVKLSDKLVLDARLVGENLERSIAGQVEFWARLGQSVERLLDGEQVLKLSRNSGTRPLSSILESVDSPAGKQRLAEFLQSAPFPHYEPHPHRAGILIRIDEDGSRSEGRFIKRKFVASRTAGRRSVSQ